MHTVKAKAFPTHEETHSKRRRRESHEHVNIFKDRILLAPVHLPSAGELSDDSQRGEKGGKAVSGTSQQSDAS